MHHDNFSGSDWETPWLQAPCPWLQHRAHEGVPGLSRGDGGSDQVPGPDEAVVQSADVTI